MTTAGNPATQEGARLLLAARVRDFYDRYTSILDDDNLEEWPGFFTEDAVYRIIARENVDLGLAHATLYCRGNAMLRDRVNSIRKAMIFQNRHIRRFTSSVCLKSVEPGTIKAQANFLVVESFADAVPEIAFVGRYMDEIVDEGISLLLRRRDCVFDNHWTPRSVILPI